MTRRDIESMHRMRELENSHRVYGITGLSENFRVVMTELKNPEELKQFCSRILTLASMLPVNERSKQTFAWRSRARNEPTSVKKEIAILVSL